MKTYFLLLALLVSGVVLTQNKYLTKTGTLTFEASVPSFEEVKASNNSVTAILNADTGEFAALALVKAFRFKNALMQEHFNESYAESDDYPKAIFSGKIKDFALGRTNTIEGELTFHGKSKTYNDLEIEVEEQGDDLIIIAGAFVANVSDFGISIPKVVSNKLSDKVQIQFEFKLRKK